MQRIGIFCASSDHLNPRFYTEAARLGTWMASHGCTLVYGGANCGLMEATARAVHEGGGHIVGVTPQILVDNQRVSSYIDEQIITRDLNDRKQQLLELSDVIIVLPGSLGTLDEAFTVMAANTIGLHTKRIIFWNIDHFWDSLFHMLDELQTTGVVNKPYDDVFLRVETLDELTQYL